MSWREKIIDKEIDFIVEKIRLMVAEEKMTPLERFACLATKKEPDRLPIFAASNEWAAHYIGYQLNKDFAFDSKKWIHCALKFLERVGSDICLPIYDIYNIGPDAMGAKVIFPEDALPEIREPAIKTPDDLKNLKVPDPHREGRMPLLIEALKTLRTKIGDIIPIYTIIMGPFSWAANLRGIYNFLADLKRNPKFALDLLDIVTDAAIKYTKALNDLGFAPVALADVVASSYLLSPKQFDDFVIPPYMKIQEALGRETFIPGAIGDYDMQAKMFQSGIGSSFNVLGMNNYTYCDRTGTEPLKEEDLVKGKTMAKKLGTSFMANIWGQWVQVHSPREIDEEVKRVIKIVGPEWPFMVGLWYVPLGTPVENLDAFIRAIKKYGKFPIKL
ncbi:MAG: uroporphyrinogen decarboxylase family protein [Candidatus Jordarchaeaceae archaeon]